MATVMKTIERPARTEVVVDHATCDLCKSAIREPRGSSEVDEVQISQTTRTHVIRREVGDHWPGDSCVEYESFDVCSSCWEERIKPFFAQFGAVPRPGL